MIEPIAPSQLPVAARKLTTLVLYTLSTAATLATFLFILASETLPNGGGILRIFYPVMGVPTAALVTYTRRRRQRMRLLHPPVPFKGALAKYLGLLALAGIIVASVFASVIVLGRTTAGALAILAFGCPLPGGLLWRGTHSISHPKSTTAPAFSGAGEHNEPTARVFGRSRGGLVAQIVGVAVMILLLPLSMVVIAVGAALFEQQVYLGGLIVAGVGLLLIVLTIVLAILGYAWVRDRHRPLVIVDGWGVHLLLLKRVSIPWDEVTSVDVFYIRANPIMRLGLVHPKRFLDPFSRLFMKSYCVGLGMASDPPRAIVEAIRAHPRYQGG